MKIYLSNKLIADSKRYLRAALPEVKASVRIEAFARGLNYNSNAAMIASLRADPTTAIVSERKFNEFLLRYDINSPPRTLPRAIIRAFVGPIVQENPQLTIHGFGLPDQYGYGGPKYVNELTRSREEFFDDWSCDQIELALLFLQNAKKIKSLNRNQTSYNLKHGAENISRQYKIRTDLRDYVSNGALILAAIYDDYQVKRVRFDSLVAFLNISEKSVKALRSSQVGKEIALCDLDKLAA